MVRKQPERMLQPDWMQRRVRGCLCAVDRISRVCLCVVVAALSLSLSLVASCAVCAGGGFPTTDGKGASYLVDVRWTLTLSASCALHTQTRSARIRGAKCVLRAADAGLLLPASVSVVLVVRLCL